MKEGRYRPQQISKLLGIQGSKLPRLTYLIIGRPNEPPQKAGSSSYYDLADAVAMKLGNDLRNAGLSGQQIQRFTAKIKEWVSSHDQDHCFLVAKKDAISLMAYHEAEFFLRNDTTVIWVVNLDEATCVIAAELGL